MAHVGINLISGIPPVTIAEESNSGEDFPSTLGIPQPTHVMETTSENKYPCPICGEALSEFSSFQIHLRNHLLSLPNLNQGTIPVSPAIHSNRDEGDESIQT